jgi:hypothetical protein
LKKNLERFDEHKGNDTLDAVEIFIEIRKDLKDVLTTR